MIPKQVDAGLISVGIINNPIDIDVDVGGDDDDDENNNNMDVDSDNANNLFNNVRSPRISVPKDYHKSNDDYYVCDIAQELNFPTDKKFESIEDITMKKTLEAKFRIGLQKHSNFLKILVKQFSTYLKIFQISKHHQLKFTEIKYLKKRSMKYQKL